MREDDLFAGVVPFFHTAEELSFRRAAARLGVSPAAVSKAVAKLEARLGVALLVRTSRSVALTPEGSLYRDRCRDAIRSLIGGRELLSQAQEAPRGELSTSLSPVLGRLVVGALPVLTSRHPGLSVRIALTDQLTRLAQENVDVAVRIGARSDSSLISRRLLAPKWWIVGSPDYLVRRGAPADPADLDRHDCVVYLATSGRPREWVFAGAPDRAVGGPLRVDHGHLLIDAALAGLGLVQVLDFMVAPLVRDGRLERVLGDWESEGPPVHAVSTPERARTPNVRAFVAFLQETFREQARR